MFAIPDILGVVGKLQTRAAIRDAGPSIGTCAFDAYSSTTWPAHSNLGDRSGESKRGKHLIRSLSTSIQNHTLKATR